MNSTDRKWGVLDELLYIETIGLTHESTAATTDTRTMLENYLIALNKRVAPPELVAGRETLRMKCLDLLARLS